MLSRNLTLSSSGVPLAAMLYLPDGPGPHPALVVAHSAGDPLRAAPFYAHLRRGLPLAGLAVLLYDRRGSGQSGGVFATASFDDLAGDALAGVAALRAQPEIDPQRVGLYGVSQGGWIAPIAAARDPAVAFIALVSPSGVSPAEQMDYAAAYHLREAGFGEEVIARALALRGRINAYYRGQVPRAEVLPELTRAAAEPWFGPAQLSPNALPVDAVTDKWHFEMDHDPLRVWPGVRRPVAFFFGGRDRWVPVEESMARYALAAGHIAEAVLTLLPAADHLMALPGQDGEQVSAAYARGLQSWLRRAAGLE